MSTSNNITEKQKAAITAIEEGMAVRTAGKLYGVPESTLRLIRKRGYISSKSNMKNHTLFRLEEERLLANHFVKMAELGYGLSPGEMVEMAKDLAKSLCLPRLPTPKNGPAPSGADII